MACGIGAAMNSAHSLRIRNCAWPACSRTYRMASPTLASAVVRLTGLTFKPVTGLLFGLSFPMPDFAAAMTLEDGAGTVSN